MSRYYDTGLACSLLDITSQDQLDSHFLRGGLFENLVINEFMKFFIHRGRNAPISFWRDKTGNEIDLIVETGEKRLAIEIKSGKTGTPAFFKDLQKWSSLSGESTEHLFVIYAGEQKMKSSNGTLIPWKELNIQDILQPE